MTEELRSLNADLEQRVRDRTAKLEALNQELDAFCYSTSHDLRAPLRHVQGYVDMLARETGSQFSDKGRHYMQTIAAASREMGVLIDDLLAFSRMGHAEMRQTRVNLGDLLHQSFGIAALALDLADLLRDIVALGLKFLHLRLSGAAFGVHRQNIVRQRRQPAALERGVKSFGLFANKTNVVHRDSLV